MAYTQCQMSVVPAISPQFQLKASIKQKRISKACYVNAVKYRYWSFAICFIVSDSRSMPKITQFYFDSVGVQVSPSGPHAAMVDILWTKPCSNISILKVPSWPWKQQLEKTNSRCRFPTSNTSWGLQLNLRGIAGTTEHLHPQRKAKRCGRKWVGLLFIFIFFWGGGGYRHHWRIFLNCKILFLFIAVRIGSFSTYFHCLK